MKTLMRNTLRRAQLHAERGVTLIIVLLILVVVTILGIGGAQIALLGERSTRYDRDYLIATQAAEAALMDAEFDIRGPNSSASSRVAQFTQTNTGVFVPGCGSDAATRGLCEAPGDGVKPVWATVDFLDETSAARTVSFGTYTGRALEFSAGAGGIRPERMPRYIIEVVDDKSPGGDASNPPKMYRVTSIGFGPRTDIQVVMQITFRKEKG
jgi:type IV pilus assembly protein PilX